MGLSTMTVSPKMRRERERESHTIEAEFYFLERQRKDTYDAVRNAAIINNEGLLSRKAFAFKLRHVSCEIKSTFRQRNMSSLKKQEIKINGK